MGAASSVKLIYSNAFEWFQKYFEDGIYESDFRSMDKDSSGSITNQELKVWLREKTQEPNSAWKMIICNSKVFLIAHEQARKSFMGDQFIDNVVVNAEQFKEFLIHIFVISIIWVHFKYADDWNADAIERNEKLNFIEFKLACQSFRASYANEEESDEQLQSDFELLDKNEDGHIDFKELCNYCARFVNPDYSNQFITTNTNASRRNIVSDEIRSLEERLFHANKSDMDDNDDVPDDEKAVQLIAQEIDKSKAIALLEGVKLRTEIELGLVES